MQHVSHEHGFRHPIAEAAGTWVALISLLVFVSCSSDGNSARPSSRTAELTQSQHDVLAGLDIDTFEELLPRLYTQFEWAPVRTDNEITALHAEALTADDRPVQIRAQDRGDEGTAVQIRIGYFGDPLLEQQFMNALDVALLQVLTEAGRD